MHRLPRHKSPLNFQPLDLDLLRELPRAQIDLSGGVLSIPETKNGALIPCRTSLPHGDSTGRASAHAAWLAQTGGNSWRETRP